MPELLRASHAKAWAECECDEERLDVFNGFLLAAHLDALFDRHLMTFDEAGNAVYASRIDMAVRNKLGLAGALRIQRLAPEHSRYLAWHRHKFDNASSPLPTLLTAPHTE